MNTDGSEPDPISEGTFKLTDEPLHEPPNRLVAEWQRRGLDPSLCQVPPVGGVLEIARNPG